jgi:hypothetical protein
MANIPNIPKNIPQGTSVTGSNIPNQSNIPGSFEQKENSFSKSVQKSKTVKRAAATIISSREDFVAYLKKGGLDLLTSAVLFQESGDFIQSSFVIYTNHNNVKEPLSEFLLRYPNLVSPLEKINNDLRGLQDSFKR